MACGIPKIGAVCVALAAFCWGLAGGIGGLLLGYGWEPLVVAFYRGAIGLVFVSLWLILRPAASGLSDPWLWLWSTLAGLGVAGNLAFYFVSMSEGSIAVAATLMYCAPVYVFLVSFALGFEAPTLRKGIAIVILMAGILLVTGVHEIDADRVSLAGIGAGLLSGVCYALFIFSFKQAAPHGSPQATLTVAFSVFSILLFWAAEVDQTVALLAVPDWMLFGALGLFGAGVSFYLYVIGIDATAPTVASILAMIEPITAALFGFMFMDERLGALQMAGMVIVLLTVTSLSVPGPGRRARSARFWPRFRRLLPA